MAPNYADGKVYCIRAKKDNDSVIYIGSTVRPLSERMAGHRKTIKDKPAIKIYKLMAEVGIEHFYIELICNFPCTTREELLAEEGRHIRLHNTVENGANTNVAGRSQKDYYYENQDRILKEKKQYQLQNTEVLRQKDKAWYEANKEKAAEQNRKYRLENADKLKAYAESRKEEDAAKNLKWRTENAAKLKAHREEHKEEINAANRARYERNKAEILRKQKERKERKKAEAVA